MSKISNKRITKKRQSPSNVGGNHSIDQLKEFQTKERLRKEMFEKVQQALQLTDLTKSSSQTYNVFSKEKLRNYLKSPQQNSNNLIQLSRFLRRYCRSYDRLISYNASMIRPEYYTINPLIDLTEESHDDVAILQNYYSTCLEMRKLNLKSQIFTILSELWTVGAVYCYKYQDEETTLWFLLDPEYCKISSQNFDGSLNCAFDFSFFKKNASHLDYYAKEFSQKFKKYDGGESSLRWQELDPEFTLVLKTGMNNLDLVIPPLVPLFEQMIDLVDLQGLTAQRDALSTYRMVWAKLDTLSNAKEVDDWRVDPITAMGYYARMVKEALPDGISATISPLELDTLNFKDDETLENNRINNALKNLFKNSGGSQILDSTEISGTQGFLSACVCDEMMATREILPILEVIVNRHIEYNLSGHAPVEFIQVSPYTKDKVLDQILQGAQFSFPNKMAVASLLGQDPITTLGNAYLENSILKLHEVLVPLSSSFTTSKSDKVANGETDPVTGGAPESDEVTDEGEKSRNRSDR